MKHSTDAGEVKGRKRTLCMDVNRLRLIDAIKSFFCS